VVGGTVDMVVVLAAIVVVDEVVVLEDVVVVLVDVVATIDVVVVEAAESTGSLPRPSNTKTAATAATIASPTSELMMVALGITLRESQKLANGLVASSS
jgi:hypothetical protein